MSVFRKILRTYLMDGPFLVGGDYHYGGISLKLFSRLGGIIFLIWTASNACKLTKCNCDMCCRVASMKNNRYSNIFMKIRKGRAWWFNELSREFWISWKFSDWNVAMRFTRVFAYSIITPSRSTFSMNKCWSTNSFKYILYNGTYKVKKPSIERFIMFAHTKNKLFTNFKIRLELKTLRIKLHI